MVNPIAVFSCSIERALDQVAARMSRRASSVPHHFQGCLQHQHSPWVKNVLTYSLPLGPLCVAWCSSSLVVVFPVSGGRGASLRWQAYHPPTSVNCRMSIRKYQQHQKKKKNRFRRMSGRGYKAVAVWLETWQVLLCYLLSIPSVWANMPSLYCKA
jgi:hypothetical protein